jgi:hypothetical protein
MTIAAVSPRRARNINPERVPNRQNTPAVNPAGGARPAIKLLALANK